MRHKIILVLFLFLIISISTSASIDPCDNICSACNIECTGGCDTECETCVNNKCLGIPIDGGLIWLILGGAGIGAKSLLDKRKKARGAKQ